MAFNWKTFQTRTLTAIIFAAVMLTGLLWNQWSFLILFSIIHFGCWWEYLKLVEKIHNARIDVIVKWLFMICGYTLMIILFLQAKGIRYTAWIGKGGFELNLKWTFWIFLVFLLLVFLFQNKMIPSKAKWMCLAGLAYISLSWGCMLNLREWGLFDNEKEFWNKALPLGLILSIWVNDTMAYIVGSIIGKTPFSKISPKKTWEGTIGGIVLSVVVIVVIFFSWWEIFTITDWVFISLIASTFGTAGDLLESKLKRMANVKDSGNFMPGHGGFLDRFDSLLLATPAVWLYVYFMM